jgi:hypothetical protein
MAAEYGFVQSYERICVIICEQTFKGETQNGT